MTLDNYIKWFESHERLLIVAVVVGLGAFGFNHWVNRSAEVADTKAALATQAMTLQDAKVKELQVLVAQQTAQYEQERLANQRELASLTTAILARDAAATRQVAVVTGTRTPTQAVADLSTVYTLSAPVTVTDNGANVPTADLQQFTVAKIEGETAKADLVDTKTALGVSMREVGQCQTVVGTLQQAVKQDAVDLRAHDDKAAADIKQVKADARRGKWHWFWAGVVTGFMGREAIHAGTGH